MKKALLVLLPALLLSGCASLWKTMGVATAPEEAAREEAASRQIAEIRRLVDELAGKSAEIDKLRARLDELAPLASRAGELESKVAELAGAFEEIQALAAGFEDRAQLIPAETLRRLSEIIDAALETP